MSEGVLKVLCIGLDFSLTSYLRGVKNKTYWCSVFLESTYMYQVFTRRTEGGGKAAANERRALNKTGVAARV